MSQGQRVKFQGTHFYVLRDFGANSPATAITGITNANPPVVTSSAHGLSTGDVIYILDVGGMTEVNDRPYIVVKINSSSFSLYGVDSSNWGTYTSGGSFENGRWSEMCELTQHNRTGASKASIPATSVCSDEEEFEVGLAGQGTVALSFNYAPLKSTAQVALKEWDESSETMAIKLVLPKNHGIIIRLGMVQQMSDSGGVNGIYTATANILLTGKPYGPVASLS